MRSPHRSILGILAIGLALSITLETAAQQQQRGQQQGQRRGGQQQPAGARRGPSGVYKSAIEPHWFDNSRQFWYRNTLRGGAREFVLVNAEAGTRNMAFDHTRLAASLSTASGKTASATQLPFDEIEFVQDGAAVRFSAEGKMWIVNLATYNCEASGDAAPVASGDAATAPAPNAIDASAAPIPTNSNPNNPPFVDEAIDFETNNEIEPLEIVEEVAWYNIPDSDPSYFPSQAQEEATTQAQTTAEATQANEGAGGAQNSTGTEGVTGDAARGARGGAARRGGGARRGDGGRRGEGARDGARGGTGAAGARGGSGRGGIQGGGSTTAQSPDGKYTAYVQDNNVFLRTQDGQATQLSQDGVSGNAYRTVRWSPDSKAVVAFRNEPGENLPVYTIESSPRGGGRAILHSQPYPLPGDKFAAYELNVFDVDARKQIKPQVEVSDFGTPQIRWRKDGRHFVYTKTDRGHQRYRMIQVDSHTGEVVNIVDEKTNTFIWTIQRDTALPPVMSFLNNTEEAVWVSEKDGWRHFYLVDYNKPGVQTPITQGNWVVRRLQRIDEEKRQIWFAAGGGYADQDPYFVHFGRVNFDGTGLTWLTEGNGTHTIEYSPDQKYIIDKYERVDMAPVHELRRVEDGKLVTRLEESDITQLIERGWRAPEVFVAKARDGKTDIWGIIERPRNFDPAKKYPVIEDIYAGPQGSFVPKTFSATQRYSNMANLGFIVAKMDGMGTSNRSKAFHDVCWKDLGDAGFPDRILWHQAVAAKYPAYDITRVGIMGTSAGGQNALGALLFHPEFYKAAMAGCGCHDNRMDKASWNEQWMGYPVAEHYAAASNVDNAKLLQGDLLLIVGEMDTNVPVESTYRVADALIKANKDFEFIVATGMGHGSGGAYGRRRMEDFFVRSLQNKFVPNRNRPADQQSAPAPANRQ